jgi:hypothetical protein
MDVPERTCPQCGRPLVGHDRNVRFRLPDPVLSSPDQERAEGTWMTDPDPIEAVMMQVPHIGPFVRCLLPVQLTGGYKVTFGVWMAVHPDELQRIARAWHAPEYNELRFDSWLANALSSDCSRRQQSRASATPTLRPMWNPVRTANYVTYSPESGRTRNCCPLLMSLSSR